MTQANQAPLPPTPTFFPRRHGQRLQAAAEPEISLANSTVRSAAAWNSARFGQCRSGQRES